MESKFRRFPWRADREWWRDNGDVSGGRSTQLQSCKSWMDHSESQSQVQCSVPCLPQFYFRPVLWSPILYPMSTPTTPVSGLSHQNSNGLFYHSSIGPTQLLRLQVSVFLTFVPQRLGLLHLVHRGLQTLRVPRQVAARLDLRPSAVAAGEEGGRRSSLGAVSSFLCNIVVFLRYF